MPDLDLERLRGRKLFVGTPMYNGQCHSEFAFSIAKLTALCTSVGIHLRFCFIANDALITKARNETVDAFLRSGNDTLIFIDADIGFEPLDVIQLLALQTLDARAPAFDVIAAPYPQKRLSWDRVLLAAKAGLADDDPERLARYSSAIAISPAHGTTIAVNEPVEVTQAGAGFMMIRRETFDRFRDAYPQRRYQPDPAGGAAEPPPEVHAFFDLELDSKQGKIADEIRLYLDRFPKAKPRDILAFLDGDEAIGAYSGKSYSEDYAFCRSVRAAGMKVWMCPWIELSHTGSHRFTSRLVDLGAIGAV